jgi:hypothetical protein
MTDNLKENGKAVFFLPLSLFLNGGAHTAFRKFRAKGTRYSLCSIYDFENIDVFQNIATRYGLAFFEKKYSKLDYIPYFRFEKKSWLEYKAVSQKEGSPYLISPDSESVASIPQIEAPAGAKPRQGINPCGAINVFVFKRYESIDEKTCRVNSAYLLPKKYVYPLLTSSNFSKNENPLKWVLLPYNTKTGKPLAPPDLENESLLLHYLKIHEPALTNRKGTLIQGYIKRGIWWALLGVGQYNFVKFKIVWEAYGKTTFHPRLFSGNWQANQSLQAFIPCSDKEEAEQLLIKLSNPIVEKYLISSRMEGTMNWAQPGKISSILYFKDSDRTS